MLKEGKVYRLTEEGRKAWESQDVAIPAEYRRILWLIETEAHVDVVRGCLREYPDELLDEWLGELEELDLLRSKQTVVEYDLDLSAADAKARALVEEDTVRLDRDALEIGSRLARDGVYIAEERLMNRAGAEKPRAETVVLVVEDDPDQLALADLRVTMAGYVVRIADSVNALLHSLLDHGTPDILVLDVMLPDGDGFDVLAKMRRHPIYAMLPIVMLTARSDPEDIRRGLGLGADGYITKPYSKNILAGTIQRVLKQPAAG
ncbi:MAG TPA: response regulator [Burkholderiales bacterium]|nr:response regulator [Burkholderiales bacterium]